VLKSELRYFNSFRNASMPNKGQSSNCGQVVTQFSIYAPLNFEVTGLMFTEFLHHVDALLQLLMHAFTKRYCILFRTAEQRVKAVNFNVCKKPSKLLVTTATSLGLPQNLCQFNNFHTYVNQSSQEALLWQRDRVRRACQ